MEHIGETVARYLPRIGQARPHRPIPRELHQSLEQIAVQRLRDRGGGIGRRIKDRRLELHAYDQAVLGLRLRERRRADQCAEQEPPRECTRRETPHHGSARAWPAPPLVHHALAESSEHAASIITFAETA